MCAVGRYHKKSSCSPERQAVKTNKVYVNTTGESPWFWVEFTVFDHSSRADVGPIVKELPAMVGEGVGAAVVRE